jgi:hypothetical protein
MRQYLNLVLDTQFFLSEEILFTVGLVGQSKPQPNE